MIVEEMSRGRRLIKNIGKRNNKIEENIDKDRDDPKMKVYASLQH